MRRAVLEGLNSRCLGLYQPRLAHRATILVADILHKPDCKEDHFRRFAASVVLGTLYGWPPIDATSNKLVREINDLVQLAVRALAPGEFLVDTFPVMAYIPAWMAKWKREGEEWFNRVTSLFVGFFTDVEEKMVFYCLPVADLVLADIVQRDGTSQACLAADLVQARDRFQFSKTENAWLSGTLL